jgi:hypothetical protein
VTLAHFVREVDVQLSHLGSSRQGHRFGFLGFYIKKVGLSLPHSIIFFTLFQQWDSIEVQKEKKITSKPEVFQKMSLKIN